MVYNEESSNFRYDPAILEPRQLSRYGDWAMSWTVQGSNPDKGKSFFFSAKVQTDPLLKGYTYYFPGIKRPEREVKHLHLVSRLRMSGAILLLPPRVYSWSVQGKPFYVYPAICLEVLW